MVDTHCHLNFKDFNNDLSDVVRRAKEKGVEKIIVPGTDLESSKKAVQIAQQFPGVCYATIGIHPHHAQDHSLKVDDKLLKQLKKLITSCEKVVAIGETGLDYYVYQKTKYEKNEITEEIKSKQKQLFLMQLELAVIHKKPVIIHCRQAYPDLITLLENISRTHLPQTNYIKPSQLKGVFHCFSGNIQQLQHILTMGYFVGFDGNITYSQGLDKIVASTPLDRLLLETDSPYLTPTPFRGQRNEPANLPLIAQAVANFKHISPAQVIQQTTTNAHELFKI